MSEKIAVGIDVAKATLDVAFGPAGTVATHPNTPAGHEELLSALPQYQIDLVVLEATGTCEVPAGCALQATGYAVAIVKSAAGTLLSPRQWEISRKSIGLTRALRCSLTKSLNSRPIGTR
jgi:transposase